MLVLLHNEGSSKNGGCRGRGGVLPTPILESTEEAVVAEATPSINDPQNGSNPEDLFHHYLLAESKLIPSLLFHCRLRRNE